MKDAEIIRGLQEKFGMGAAINVQESRLTIEEHRTDANHFFRVTAIKDYTKLTYPTIEMDALINWLQSGEYKENLILIPQLRIVTPHLYEDKNPDRKKARLLEVKDYTKRLMAAEAKLIPFIFDSLQDFIDRLLNEMDKLKEEMDRQLEKE